MPDPCVACGNPGTVDSATLQHWICKRCAAMRIDDLARDLAFVAARWKKYHDAACSLLDGIGAQLGPALRNEDRSPECLAQDAAHVIARVRAAAPALLEPRIVCSKLEPVPPGIADGW